MTYIVNLISKELANIENTIDGKRKGLSLLTAQIHNMTVEIYQLEQVYDELLNELEKYQIDDVIDEDIVDDDDDDDDYDLPIRFEGSD